ncbi:MAG: FprA family A-type flavoprotein, partial [Candidatus Omnitrophica bacterium]|nr:FprA family A-type flavoprotein [Candidatus Omnitrophota bacterium]
MDNAIPVTKDIFWTGVNDTKTQLFEAIWPLPHGISYNSYVINDEKVLLVDTVKESFIETYLDNIKNALQNKKGIDYLVITHMEPDHSGAIKALLEEYPGIQIIGNAKTAELLKCFFGIEKNVKVIKDKETLQTGRHKLTFLLTPMVHWPETMMAYEEADRVLFSGDAFGGFGTLDKGIFDDEVDLDFFEEETRRYFSNIIGKYSAMVQKAISQLKELDICAVASTHGPVYRKDPQRIISRYSKWSNYETENGAVIVYGSMYGNTEKMAEAVARKLAEEKIKDIRVHDVSRSHISFIINDIWRFKGLILAGCTYNTRLFPLMDNLTRFLENETIKNHVLGVIGNYGWSGGA